MSLTEMALERASRFHCPGSFGPSSSRAVQRDPDDSYRHRGLSYWRGTLSIGHLNLKQWSVGTPTLCSRVKEIIFRMLGSKLTCL